MDENCNKDCEGCSEESGQGKGKGEDFSESPHELSNIKKVIAIVSGKGGVGKSLVTSILGVTMKRRGHNTAILDADITGPSIPKAFGIDQKATGSDLGMFPAKSITGINIMSTNMLLAQDTDPVIWRGPIIAGAVKQFWTDVIWGDVDYMFIDMPPGTGDVPLTVFQSIPVDGIVIVTSPQELVSMIVSKAVKMAEMMNIPILGIVENMSYFRCPDCGENHEMFGESHIDDIAKKHNLDVLAKIPIEKSLALACDRGMVENFIGDWMDDIAEILENKGKKESILKIAVASDDNRVTEHFGHCETFNIFEIKEDTIIDEKIVPNPGHKPGFLPKYLNDLGINIIISGGMGQGAIDIFDEKGIKVITGAKGDSRETIIKYIEGNLKASDSACKDHIH